MSSYENVRYEVRGAAAWLREHPGAARRARFDVIVCEPDPITIGAFTVTWTNGSEYGSLRLLINGDIIEDDDGTLWDLSLGAENT